MTACAKCKKKGADLGCKGLKTCKAMIHKKCVVGRKKTWTCGGCEKDKREKRSLPDEWLTVLETVLEKAEKVLPKKLKKVKANLADGVYTEDTGAAQYYKDLEKVYIGTKHENAIRMILRRWIRFDMIVKMMQNEVGDVKKKKETNAEIAKLCIRHMGKADRDGLLDIPSALAKKIRGLRPLDSLKTIEDVNNAVRNYCRYVNLKFPNEEHPLKTFLADLLWWILPVIAKQFPVSKHSLRKNTFSWMLPELETSSTKKRKREASPPQKKPQRGGKKKKQVIEISSSETSSSSSSSVVMETPKPVEKKKKAKKVTPEKNPKISRITPKITENQNAAVKKDGMDNKLFGFACKLEEPDFELDSLSGNSCEENPNDNDQPKPNTFSDRKECLYTANIEFPPEISFSSDSEGELPAYDPTRVEPSPLMAQEEEGVDDFLEKEGITGHTSEPIESNLTYAEEVCDRIMKEDHPPNVIRILATMLPLPQAETLLGSIPNG